MRYISDVPDADNCIYMELTTQEYEVLTDLAEAAGVTPQEMLQKMVNEAVKELT